MIRNKTLSFVCKNSNLKVNNNSRFTNLYKKDQIIKIPISHGEGNYQADKNTINKLVSKNGLSVNSYISYADHYADTLAIWRDEFNKKWSLIKEQGFDLTFRRMWEFYLSYCEAGFKSKNIDLIQFSLQSK